MTGPRIAEIARLARQLKNESPPEPRKEGGMSFRDLGYAEVMQILEKELIDDPLAFSGRKMDIHDYLFNEDVIPHLDLYPRLASTEERKSVNLVPALIVVQSGHRSLLYTAYGWQIAEMKNTQPITYDLRNAARHLDLIYDWFGIQPEELYRRFNGEIEALHTRVQTAVLRREQGLTR